MIKNKIHFAIMDIVDILLVFKTTLPCLIVALFDKEFFPMLPHSLSIDVIILIITNVYTIYRQNKELKGIIADLSEDHIMHKCNDEESIIIKGIYDKWLEFLKDDSKFNYRVKNKSKDIEVICVENGGGNNNKKSFEDLVCAPYSFQSSIVFVPKHLIDSDDVKFVAKLVHEFSHCINHDSYFHGTAYNMLATSVIYIALGVALGFPWLSIVSFIIVSTIIWLINYITKPILPELEANRQAVSFIEQLYGKTEAKNAAYSLFYVQCSNLEAYNNDIKKRGTSYKEVFSSFNGVMQQILLLGNEIINYTTEGKERLDEDDIDELDELDAYCSELIEECENLSVNQKSFAEINTLKNRIAQHQNGDLFVNRLEGVFPFSVRSAVLYLLLASIFSVSLLYVEPVFLNKWLFLVYLFVAIVLILIFSKLWIQKTMVILSLGKR